jgi:hypothetical protein
MMMRDEGGGMKDEPNTESLWIHPSSFILHLGHLLRAYNGMTIRNPGRQE